MLKRRVYGWLVPVYRLLCGVGVPRGARVPKSVRRVLVVRHDRLGDMILTTPVFDLLAQLAPGAEVDVLASPRNAALVRGDDRVRMVFEDDGTWLGLWRLRPYLRERQYDAVFSLIPGRSIREGWTAAVASHARTHRVSTWRPKRYHGFFTRVVRLPQSLAMAHVSRQMSYVVRAGFGKGGRDVAAASALAAPIRLAIPAGAREEAERWLASHATGDFVTINLASAAPARSWTAAECARLLPMLLARHPQLSFVLVPGPADVAEAEAVRVAAASPRVHVFDAGAPLLAVAALVSRAKLMITPDTMTLHLAVATGRPVLSLHTTTDGNVPDLWKAVGVPSRALVAPPGQAVGAIRAEEVAAAFEALLGGEAD
ncbi:MAG: glycosyltransferase family 9 protein [Gemmatimonadetes bacterium]|nr:glycosyltransferase family 9 protein [Gemmatimonadota bacterium]